METTISCMYGPNPCSSLSCCCDALHVTWHVLAQPHPAREEPKVCNMHAIGGHVDAKRRSVTVPIKFMHACAAPPISSATDLYAIGLVIIESFRTDPKAFPDRKHIAPNVHHSKRPQLGPIFDDIAVGPPVCRQGIGLKSHRMLVRQLKTRFKLRATTHVRPRHNWRILSLGRLRAGVRKHTHSHFFLFSLLYIHSRCRDDGYLLRLSTRF